MKIIVYRLASGFPTSKRGMVSGIGPTLYYISKELTNLNVEEHVVCLRPPALSISSTFEGINLHFVEKPYTINSVRKVHKLWSMYPPDIMHGHVTGAFSCALLKCVSKKFRKVPLVTHVHETGVEGAKITLPPFKDTLGFLRMARWYCVELPLKEKIIYQAAERLVAVSYFLANSLTKYGVSQKKVTVIHNGVDIDIFKPVKGGKPKAKRLLGLDGSPLILYVGAFTTRKGIHYLIRSFKNVLNEFKNATLLLIGGVPSWYGSNIYYDLLFKEIDKLNLRDHIKTEGAIPHNRLPLYYSAADVFVLPSIYEPFGKVLLEAMACGTPVVASNVGGIPEIVEDGRSGFLVPVGDVKGFSESICTLLSSDTLIRRMGSYGQSLVMKNFTWRSTATKLFNMYMELLNFVH